MAEKTVRIIQPTVALVKENEIQRVAAYCRVSTDSEDQANSFSAQLKYYSDFIRSNDKMQLVDIYADEGITGTCINKRDEFKRMMRDASHGKIDRIFVKSVSRFARNSMECLETIRTLTAYGTSVLFENDNIDTRTMSSELVLYVKSAFAQSEALAGSLRVQTAVRMKMENGEFITYAAPYGFSLNKDGLLIVIPEQAETVRLIFEMYLNGNGTEKIVAFLNSNNVPAKSGQWTVPGVYYILNNEKYIGDSLLRKTYTPQILPLRNRPNYGQADKYYMAGSHEAIISKEVFEAAQARLHRNSSEEKKRNTEKHLFAGMIQCEECGWAYKRRIQSGTPYWVCSRKSNAGQSCGGKNISEENLMSAFVSALNKLRRFEKEVLDATISQLLTVRERIAGQNDEITGIDAEIAKLCDRNSMYSNLKTNGVIDEITFLEKTAEIRYKLAELRNRRTKYLNDNEEEQIIENLRILKEILSDYPAVSLDFDPVLFSRIAEKVLIGNDGSVAFRLLGGITIRYDCVEA